MAKDSKLESIPWDDVISSTLWYTTYREKDSEGNISRYIMIIKDKNGSGLPSAVHSCHLLGMAHGWPNYHINIPIGPESGSEIDHLYVELKPIKNGVSRHASNR